MLISLRVRDFAIVDEVDIDIHHGLTVLTGETGAGKSILIDALGLVLGERGSAQMVRHDANRAQISAEFDIDNLARVSEWLRERELDADDACLLRRVINSDGRSRAFINGNAVPISQLKSLGELLLDIHGQHFHQSLGKRSVQRDLLDHFGGLLKLRAKTEACFADWTRLSEQLKQIYDADADSASRLDLLTFQLQELESLGLGPDEAQNLVDERLKLKNSGRIADGVREALRHLTDDDAANANSLVAETIRSLGSLSEYDDDLLPMVELLESAGVQIAETTDLLSRYANELNLDPQRRDWVEDRVAAIQSLARKHRVKPDELLTLVDKLQQDRDAIDHAEERGRELEKKVAAAKLSYLECAKSLSSRRRKAAVKFAAAVTESMNDLGMPGGSFEVSITELNEVSARPWGMDAIEFMISANPGHPLQPLSRVASGGELSRMSLSIQVIASDGSTIPTMIFDEVDNGVGGGVAEMVGRRLQELGDHRQVLCVTHLPQVASLADQHFRVNKITDGKSTRTRLHVLRKEERVEELARMLGGVEITQKTLAHAAEMLGGARQKRA